MDVEVYQDCYVHFIWACIINSSVNIQKLKKCNKENVWSVECRKQGSGTLDNGTKYSQTAV
jgi:hypothetical protein